MKASIQKYAYYIALILIISGIALYFITRPSENSQIDFELNETHNSNLLESIANLEVFGFADTLAAQKEELKKALQIFEKTDYEQAVGSLQAFSEKYPENKEAKYYLGLGLLYLKNYPESTTAFESLLNDSNSEFIEEATWFSMLAYSSFNQGESTLLLDQIASSANSPYNAAAIAIQSTLNQIDGDLKMIQTSGGQSGVHPQFSVVIEPSKLWWQKPLFRSSLLFLLPIGGVSLIFWKQKIKEANQEIIDEEVASRTAVILKEKGEIEKEKQITEEILYNILPAETADELKSGESITKRHEMVTVLFCDFEGFTKISEQLQPEELVKSLGICFEAFDKIIEEEKLEKIKTVGDCYICAGGINSPTKPSAINIINAGKKMVAFLEGFNRNQLAENKPAFNGRIGVNTGPVVAGIVGLKKFAYDIWGDTVNIAARMEQESEGGKINISESTYKLINDEFNCLHRGKIDAKGKGAIDMYYVD